ncbi:hypothetical protein [Halospeciosus flavus]|uniref:Uncharacterized protein n=1 Tax=Halospeciosus flavus TaxID=3032283 RepID=A0ABD5Z2J6_9EURY|nr:hypothetical protein [Halospeciosus flavus]
MAPLGRPPGGNFGGGPADGLVEPTVAVEEVHATGTSRYVVLEPYGESDDPDDDAFLLVERVSGPASPERELDDAEARGTIELQNGLAYFAPDVESVRVRTPASRTAGLRCELVLRGLLDVRLAYAGEQFRLSLTGPPFRRPPGSR